MNKGEKKREARFGDRHGNIPVPNGCYAFNTD